jgi:hypothetical protein
MGLAEEDVDGLIVPTDPRSPSLLQSTHQHHDRDVSHMCIRMTLSRMAFSSSSDDCCTHKRQTDF